MQLIETPKNGAGGGGGGGGWVASGLRVQLTQPILAGLWGGMEGRRRVTVYSDGAE